MKKLTLLLLCVLIGAGECEAAKKKQAKKPMTLSREIVVDRNYTGLSVGGMMRVILEADRQPGSIVVETQHVPAECVRAEVKGGVLRLSRNDRMFRENSKRSDWKITVRMGVGGIGSIVCSGMSQVSSDAAVSAETMTIALREMSNVSFALACGTLNMKLCGMSAFTGKAVCRTGASVEIDGMSVCRISGESAALKLDVSGMSKFNGKDFSVTGSTECRVSDMSRASVVSFGALKYEVSGMSDLAVSGDPRMVSASVDSANVRE